MTVYALMVEEQVEGVYFFDVRSLHKTEQYAKDEAAKLGLHSWNHYVEPMEVV